jgi:ligand-binding SRPBCC domain-containing protein
MYRHRFRTRAALDVVAAFHRQSASMAAITPPPMRVVMGPVPAELTEGDEMSFTLRLGRLAIPWTARIEDLRPEGFTDRQVAGPFASWVHVHRFAARADGTVEVLDEVDARLSRHPWWFLVGLGMKLSLPLLFAYRAWMSRRILEQGR